MTEGEVYSRRLKELHIERERLKAEEKKRPRQSLKSHERKAILEKTNSRCHVCGGSIKGKWDADHILSHSKGGKHSVDNYLPAHKICNNYRWDYLAEEFQEIIKIGVWARTQAEKETGVGKKIAQGFAKHEIGKLKRRKNDI